jgi:hypothetical protein
VIAFATFHHPGPCHARPCGLTASPAYERAPLHAVCAQVTQADSPSASGAALPRDPITRLQTVAPAASHTFSGAHATAGSRHTRQAGMYRAVPRCVPSKRAAPSSKREAHLTQLAALQPAHSVLARHPPPAVSVPSAQGLAELLPVPTIPSWSACTPALPCTPMVAIGQSLSPPPPPPPPPPPSP